ncbi:MAG: hypothetical protein NVSMB17_03000 [Candidatus Dormibacteria bacterium]
MAKKNTIKQARLDERAAQIQTQVAAERRRTQVIIAVFAVIVVGGAGLLYFLTNPPSFGGGSTSGSSTTSVSMGVRNGVGVGKSLGAAHAVTDEGRGHVVRPARVTYNHQPPSSGMHYNDQGAPHKPWGAVQSELLPEEFVHNLEHGGIDLVYRCSGTECDAANTAAQALFAALPKEAQFQEVKLLALPYQAMTPRVALLAWGNEQDFDGMPTVADATAFYNQFVDKGPEATP